MLIINACRDLLEGLSRGFTLFFTDRGDGNDCYTIPEAAWPKCMPRKGMEASRTKPE
jgi:hypothetical protein